MRTHRLLPLSWVAAIALALVVAPALAQSGPETERVTIESGGTFDPESLEIPSGWSVEWMNNDSESHVLLIDFGEDEPFNVGEIGAGESVTIAFDEDGAYVFYLEDAPDAEGTVVVGDAEVTPAPPTEEPSSAATATSEPSDNVTSPASQATPSPEATATPEPTPGATSEATPEATPPPPSAGSGGMFATPGGPVAQVAVLVGLSLMLIALSSVARSAAHGRIAVHRRQDRRDR